MSSDVRTLLTRPGEFFADREDDPSLKGPAAIVVTIAVLSAVAGAVVLLQFGQVVPADARGVFVVGAVIGVLVSVAVPFVTWLLYAIAFHLLTALFDGEGEFRDTFVFTGWGFLPRVLATLVSLVVTLYVVQVVDAPTEAVGFASYSQRIQGTPLVQVSTVVGVVFTLWSAYIWVAAVERARSVTRRQAYVAVAVPVLIAIFLSLTSLVVGTGT